MNESDGVGGMFWHFLLVSFLAVGGLATAVALVIFNGLVHGYFGGPGGPMNSQPLPAFVLDLLFNSLFYFIRVLQVPWWKQVFGIE